MRAEKPIEFKTRTLANGYQISYRNVRELEVISDDIFAKNTYFFESDSASPRIIDCGGHIGLAVLYFKSIYPNSKIITFEPNPETFFLLKRNIVQNGLRGVEAVNAALSRENNKYGALYVGEDFIHAWDSTGTIKADLWPNMDQYRRISVQTARLSSYINGNVDFLKLDIEGAEYEVLKESRAKMGSVDAITLEYHENPRNLAKRRLHKTLELLEEAGFRYELFHQAKPITLECLPRESIYQLIVRATRKS
jgi:FkbM family methyltransferase